MPEDATVYINGHRTTRTGTHCDYVSTGLERGYAYIYRIRAERTLDGKVVSESQEITLEAGDTRCVVFTFSVAGNAVLAEPR